MKDNIMNEELIEKIKDPKFYLENFCRIKIKKGGFAPFILNEAQKDLFNTIKKNNRIMVLKARQLGFSSGIAGYFYHQTITNPGITTALIGYNSDLVSELLDKVKTFIRTTPRELRPEIKYNSKYEISFPKIDSKILILPSTENVGSGYTLHNVLLTELPKIKNAEEKMASLAPAVPIGGKFIIESSPKGVGNLFHRMWMDDSNGWIKKMYHWRWGYTKAEIEQIRKEINDPQIFAQEYGLEFLQSGRPVFQEEILKQHRKNIWEVGYVVSDDGINKEVVYKDGDWTFYHKPKPDGLYVCGGDTSEGVSGGDYSVGIIWERKTGEEVAMFRGLLSPDKFAMELDRVGRMYNNAYMVVEVNNQGLTTLTVLRQLVYPSLYFRQAKFDTLTNTITDKMGWRTSQVNRELLINEFKRAVNEFDLTIHSKILLDEMTVFVYDDANDMVSPAGFHDDSIFSAAIGFQGFKNMPDRELEQINDRDYMPKTFAY